MIDAFYFMDFLILGLTTWRLSSLLVQEDGPFFIFVRFRSLVGIKWNELGEEYSDSVFGQVFLCVWCLSIWIGIALSLLYLFFGSWLVYLCWPLALSGLACIVQGVANR